MFVLFIESAALFSMPLDEGEREIIMSGMVGYKTPAGKTGYDVNLALGYFLLDDWEVGPGLIVVGDGADNGWGLGGFTEFNFNFGMAFVPYVGAHLHYLDGDYFRKNVFRLAGVFGVKYFLTENVAIDAALQYLYATDDIYKDDESWRNYDFGLSFGVRAFF